MSMLRALVALLLCSVAGTAAASGTAVPWSMSPDLVPWETMTLAADAHRPVGRGFPEIARQRAALQEVLDNGALAPRERATAMIGLGDLFRDEARLVLQGEAADPWRIPLHTTPAWLQLELAVGWYDKALAIYPEGDPDGRIALLRAVTMTRLDDPEEAFETYAQLIREYRGTPYVEMAKLAVGDHHLRAGDVARARMAYRLVRAARDGELAVYANYRLADCAAREGESPRAVELLQEMLGDASPSAMVQSIQQAGRTALANHVAWSTPLHDTLIWLESVCPQGDAACHRDTRDAAADSFDRTKQWRAAAWLRTVDRQQPLAEQLERRLDLAAIPLDNVPAERAIERVEAACSQQDDACRATLAHALTDYFAELGRPEAGWLREYELLPKIRGRPDLNQRLGVHARTYSDAGEALADLIERCGEPSCDESMRVALRRVYDMGWRKRDALWLAMVADPPGVPDLPAASEAMAEVVRGRLDARRALDRLEPYCDTESCNTTIQATLLAYFEATGQNHQLALLAALHIARSLPLPDELRAPFLETTRRGDPVDLALRTVMGGCVAPGSVCFQLARAALDVFYTTAREHPEAAFLQALAPLADLAPPAQTFDAFLSVALEDLGAHEALVRIEPRCGGDLSCILMAHNALIGWYTGRERFEDVRIVRNQESVPYLGAYPTVRRLFKRVVVEEDDPIDALRAIAGACGEDDGTCAREVVTALADWYGQQGRDDDANRVRSSAGSVLSGTGF